MQPAELGDDQVGIGRALELDGDVGLQPRHVGLFHRAAQVDGDVAVGFLEIDQPRQDPEIARTFGHGNPHRAARIVRRLRRAAKYVEGLTFHFRDVADHRGAFVAQRQSALVAQEQLAADAFLEPVDPAHQRGCGQAERLGGVAKTLEARTGEKRFQIVPRRIQHLLDPVLRHRSTPVQ